MNFAIAIYILIFITLGIPILSFLALVLFTSLHLAGWITCSWWWITIPAVFFVGSVIFDWKTEYSSKSK